MFFEIIQINRLVAGEGAWNLARLELVEDGDNRFAQKIGGAGLKNDPRTRNGSRTQENKELAAFLEVPPYGIVEHFPGPNVSRVEKRGHALALASLFNVGGNMPRDPRILGGMADEHEVSRWAPFS